MRVRAHRRLPAVLLVVSLGVVAACGDDDEETETTSVASAPEDTGASTTAAVTTEPVTTEPVTTESESPGTSAEGTEAPAPTETGGTVAEPETELLDAAAQDINPQPRDSLQQGGEFRYPVASLAENWNPHNVNGNEDDFSRLRDPLSPRLFNFDAESVAAPNEDFLLEATFEAGPPQVVTYRLNPDAKWNSGTPITVTDFQALWQAIVNPENQVAATEGYEQIESVEQGADEFEVVVTFSTVYPDWQALFDDLVPADSIDTPEKFNNGWVGEINPDWFAGPFTIGSYDAGQGIVEEIPNPNWWGDPPLLDKIIFRVVEPDAWATAYGNNELDAFDIGPDPNAYAIAEGTSGGTILAAAGPNWRHITFNTTAGLIADQTIRQAIVRSLDRAEIGASDLAGIPWPAKPLNNHIFVENQAGYEDNAGDFEYDPDRARADLEAAGWVEGSDGVREKDGERLTVKFMQLVGVPVSENEAQLVQNQLADVGIEVEIVDVPVDQFSDVLVAGDFELIAFSWIGTPFPFRGIDQLFGTGSDSNFARTDLPEVDALIDQIAVETDVAQRTELANQVDEILWDVVHTLPLYQRPELTAAREDLANFGSFGFSSPIPEDWGYME